MPKFHSRDTSMRRINDIYKAFSRDASWFFRFSFSSQLNQNQPKAPLKKKIEVKSKPTKIHSNFLTDFFNDSLHATSFQHIPQQLGTHKYNCLHQNQNWNPLIMFQTDLWNNFIFIWYWSYTPMYNVSAQSSIQLILINKTAFNPAVSFH